MYEDLKDFFKGILFFVILFAGLIGIMIFLSSMQDKLNKEACNEIGYTSYLRVNIMDYCSNDSIDLYSVNIEDVSSFFHWKYKATKINLYNYGDEKEK